MSSEDLRLPEPEADFSLTPEERASVQPRFDVDALERLLGMLKPSERAYHFASFQVQLGDRRRELALFGDPALNAALAVVWRPYWDSLPDRALDDPSISRWAGVAEARARRALRVAGGGTTSDPPAE